MLKLSNRQLEAVRQIAEVGKRCADDMLRIMDESGLSQIPGSRVWITVNPEFDTVTNSFEFGSPGMDSGYIHLNRGREEKRYEPLGKNSAEYEIIFANEATRRRLQEILSVKKELPPDGLWLSVYDDYPAVDYRG